MALLITVTGSSAYSVIVRIKNSVREGSLLMPEGVGEKREGHVFWVNK